MTDEWVILTIKHSFIALCWTPAGNETNKNISIYYYFIFCNHQSRLLPHWGNATWRASPVRSVWIKRAVVRSKNNISAIRLHSRPFVIPDGGWSSWDKGNGVSAGAQEDDGGWMRCVGLKVNGDAQRAGWGRNCAEIARRLLWLISKTRTRRSEKWRRRSARL